MNRYTGSMVIALYSLFTLTLSTSLAAAGYGNGMSETMDDGGSITVLAPKMGQTLKGGSGIKLQYKVHLSPKGNHLHVYVDNGNPIIVRKVSGCPCSIKLPDLAPGRHTVSVKEATSSHALTEVESSVVFTVQ